MKLCFVIGPMKDMDRLNRLAYQIVEPLLSDQEFLVRTPDQPNQGLIMHQVIESLDRAELVIADLTGANPNVLYELGLRHCLGLPCILITESNGAPKPEDVPFDLRHYRHAVLPEFTEVTEGQKRLGPIIASTLKDAAMHKEISNPVTDYFKAPLTEISTAPGLAEGYFRNFVLPTATAMHKAGAKWRINDMPRESAQLQHLFLNIVLPDRIGQTTRDKIQNLLVEPGKMLKNVVIESEGRQICLCTRSVATDEIVLVDVPTTMNVLRATVEHRLNQGKPDPNDSDYMRVETQERVRFEHHLRRCVAADEVTAPKVRFQPWSFLEG
jgi:hypothetical protein